MDIPDIEEIRKNIRQIKRHLQNNHPEFYKYINETYNCKTLGEKLYWYYNGLTDYPKCVCGNKVNFQSFTKGYFKHCSSKCSRNDNEVKNKQRETCIKKYGVDNPSKSQIILEKIKQVNLEKYGVQYFPLSKDYKDKSESTCIKKYGVKHYSETAECKAIISKKSEESNRKRRLTNISKYGVESAMELQEIKDKKKQTTIDKYGVEWYTQSQEYKIKLDDFKDIKNKHMFETKKKHGTLASSSVEIEFAKWLDGQNIPYEYQHHDDIYPFDCDFYFPEKHLYFEIQGTWTHGGHPFNDKDENDLIILEKWRSKHSSFYNTAIKTWTINDVKKRKLVVRNNINWVEVFSDKLEQVIMKFKENYYLV